MTPTTATSTCPRCGQPTAANDQSCMQCGHGLAGRALLASSKSGAPVGTPGGAVLLLLIAAGLLFVGMMFLTPATAGVGIVATACFLGIWARIVQAAAFHKDLVARQSSR
jgi:hypothetical protein